jgi:putative SOS response-associated peptidase YedK
MCGRFTNRYSWREINELYDLTTPYLTSNFPPRYNIAPTQQSFVVRLAKDGARELAELKWGLIPSWSKDDKGAGGDRRQPARVPRRLQGAPVPCGRGRLL